jgi:hypothetical protein
MKMGQTERYKTSTYKIQTLVNYPEERVQHSEHGKSCKSRINGVFVSEQRWITPQHHMLTLHISMYFFTQTRESKPT